MTFSGELLAMVIIGGMRSLMGPALGALFFILFREFLSIWTPNWLLFFGLLFVGFVVYSPTGLVGVWRRFTEPMRPKVDRGGGDGRVAGSSRACRCRRSCCTMQSRQVATLDSRSLAKSFGGIQAVVDAGFAVAPRTLHALIGPNGAGKTTVFNLISGMFAPDRGSVTLGGVPIYRPGRRIGRLRRDLRARSRSRTCSPACRSRRTFALPCRRTIRRGSNGWSDAQSIERVMKRTAELIGFLGLTGIERADAGTLSYGGQRLLDMGLALASGPRVLLLDEPLAGLRRRRARARRQSDQAHLGRHSGAARRA